MPPRDIRSAIARPDAERVANSEMFVSASSVGSRFCYRTACPFTLIRRIRHWLLIDKACPLVYIVARVADS